MVYSIALAGLIPVFFTNFREKKRKPSARDGRLDESAMAAVSEASIGYAGYSSRDDSLMNASLHLFRVLQVIFQRRQRLRGEGLDRVFFAAVRFLAEFRYIVFMISDHIPRVSLIECRPGQF